MSFLKSFLESLFGSSSGGGGDPFAGHDPDDLEMYWVIDHELTQVDEGQLPLQDVLRSHGVSSRSQLEHVQGAYGQRHQNKPEFNQACVRVQTRIQMAAFHELHGGQG